MGKNNKKRKRNHALFHAAKARMNHNASDATDPVLLDQKATTTDPLDANTTTPLVEGDEISDAALATTLATLEHLVAHPTQFHDKRFKDLRRTLHPLVVEQMQSYDKGIDYRHKVTHALAHQKWSDALAALQACRDFQQLPKQGTVQRWVRDCTTAAAAKQAPNCHVQLLQSILRTTTEDGAPRDTSNKHDPGQALVEQLASNQQDKDEMTILEGWKWWGDEKTATNTTKEDDDTPTDKKIEVKSRILYQEAAADRTPPNHYDLHLHITTPPTTTTEEGDTSSPLVTWASPPPPTAFHAVPFLPSPSRVLSNALTYKECQQLRHVMTTLGYRPDHPVALEPPTGIDSCEWWVDDSIAQTLFERVQPHLPATMTLPGLNGKQVQLHSINPRWRCFRYGPDCEYRPHLDGSWPHSYLHPETGEYCCPKQSAVKSYLTCLIYLNDDFEGGETRFYLPQGVARGIVPRTGSIAVFPQGNTASLIHEGSQVTKGTKYVVRTDVLYRPILEEEEPDDGNDDMAVANDHQEENDGDDSDHDE